MLTRKNVLIIVLVVVLAVVFGFFITRTQGTGYSVVYLSSGEVYIGQLSTFPDMTLKNAYVLQITKDPTDATKNNFQLNPISEAIWAPTALHINSKNVIFYGPLTANSKIAQTLAAPKK